MFKKLLNGLGYACILLDIGCGSFISVLVPIIIGIYLKSSYNIDFIVDSSTPNQSIKMEPYADLKSYSYSILSINSKAGNVPIGKGFTKGLIKNIGAASP